MDINAWVWGTGKQEEKWEKGEGEGEFGATTGAAGRGGKVRRGAEEGGRGTIWGEYTSVARIPGFSASDAGWHATPNKHVCLRAVDCVVQVLTKPPPQPDEDKKTGAGELGRGGGLSHTHTHTHTRAPSTAGT